MQFISEFREETIILKFIRTIHW